MIIDSNVVYGFDRLNKTLMDPASILKNMDKIGIDKAIITSYECMYYDFKEGNQKTSDLVKNYPDRFIGFLSFHVARFINVVDEVERGTSELNLEGIRLFFTEVTFGRGWSSGLRSLVLQRVMEKANELKLPIFLEAGFTFVDIKAFADAYPATKLIASGVGYANMAEAILAVQSTPNLYLELSTLDTFEGIRYLVEHLKSDRLIFGTGIPFNTPSVALNSIRYAVISEEDKENILGKNIQKILNR